MSLFKLQEVDSSDEIKAESWVSAAKILELQFSYESNQKMTLQRTFEPFVRDRTYKFYTDGAWSMHHLIQFVIEKIGPCEVVLSTWTITENPARILLNLKECGLITKLHCLLDYRIQDRSPKSFQLIKELSDTIKLTHTHAKVATMINSEWGVSIVGSSNLSKNRRLEAGTVFTSKKDAQFDKDMILKSINA